MYLRAKKGVIGDRIPQCGKSRRPIHGNEQRAPINAMFHENVKVREKGSITGSGDYLRSTKGSCHRDKFIVAVGGTGERRKGRRFDNRKYGPEIPAPRWNLSAMKSSHRRLLFLLTLAPATVLDVDSDQALTLFTGFGFRGPFDRSETIRDCVSRCFPGSPLASR